MSLPVSPPLWKLGCTGEFGCRCPHKQAVYARRSADREHGTRRKYTRGCRCTRCTTANRAYQRKWRKKKAKEG